jgi:hypothetical protein
VNGPGTRLILQVKKAAPITEIEVTSNIFAL